MQKIVIKEADAPHKYQVHIGNNTVKFGAYGYEDYPKNKDPDRKQRYIQRHQNEQAKGFWRFNQNNLYRPAFWSRWILWNKPTLFESAKDVSKQMGIKILVDAK